VFPASTTDLQTSSSVIERKSILHVATIGISDSISPASALLVSSSVTSSSLFSSVDFAGRLSRYSRSLSERLR
jgi:hypothetical protein